MSGVAMIPMDPQKRDDHFYRYKMPAITIKVEGSGNGIKTVFPNIHDVCLAINRPEALIMKFFQIELGTQRTVSDKDDKFLVMGLHTQERLQEKVYDFIQQFVLCKNCGNPETACQVSGKGKLTLLCGACGKRSEVSPTQRLYSLFVTWYKEHGGNATARKKTVVHGPEKVLTETADSMETKAPAPTEKIASYDVSDLIVDEQENPHDILRRELIENPDSYVAHVNVVQEIRTLYNSTPNDNVRLVFRSITSLDEKNFIAQLQQHLRLLMRFVRVKDLNNGKVSISDEALEDLRKQDATFQRILISECERQASMTDLQKMPIVLLMLFENHVIDELAILDWINSKPSSRIGQARSSEMRRLSAPLADWLKA